MNILTSQASINSQQIAEMLKVRHDKVKQSIERLSSDNEHRLAVIACPPMGVVQTTANNRNYEADVYIFSGEQGRIDSIIVVAQLSPEFTAALVKRWDELEKGLAQAPVVKIPQSFAEALQLAADQALKIEQDAPKVNFYDTVAERDNLMTVTQVATKLGMSAQALNKRLVTLGAYDGRIKRCKTFTSEFIAKGYGQMKVGSTGHDQGLITQAGQAWIVGLFGDEVTL